jgi:hypothetical protein
MTYRGYVEALEIPQWGLPMLTVRRADGTTDQVPAEAPVVAAALLRWFGEEMLTPAVRSCEVVCSTDELGILIGITPYDRWLQKSRPVIPAEGIDDDDIYRAVQKIIRTGKVS